MRKTPKENYRDYKRDGVVGFSEWIGIRTPELVYLSNGMVMMTKLCRTKYSSNIISGDPAKTIKEAKKSYKEALNKHLIDIRNWNRRISSDE